MRMLWKQTNFFFVSKISIEISFDKTSTSIWQTFGKLQGNFISSVSKSSSSLSELIKCHSICTDTQTHTHISIECECDWIESGGHMLSPLTFRSNVQQIDRLSVCVCRKKKNKATVMKWENWRWRRAHNSSVYVFVLERVRFSCSSQRTNRLNRNDTRIFAQMIQGDSASIRISIFKCKCNNNSKPNTMET